MTMSRLHLGTRTGRPWLGNGSGEDLRRSGTHRRWSCLSWKVRYRTIPWFFSQMSKLYRARSLLYRRQILQWNIRWKALDEIYKSYMFLHRSDINISKKNRHFFASSGKFCNIYPFSQNVIEFCEEFGEILSEVRKYFQKFECWKILNFVLLL